MAGRAHHQHEGSEVGVSVGQRAVGDTRIVSFAS